MPTHPLFWLAIVTFLIVVSLAAWNFNSTRRRQKSGAGGKEWAARTTR